MDSGQEVKITMLVTDKGAELLSSTDDRDEHQAAVADAVRSALIVGATRFEVRRLTWRVPLLAPVTSESHDASEAQAQVELPTEVVERLRREYRAEQAERLQSMLMDTLEPGVYEVTRDAHSRGIRRIK